MPQSLLHLRGKSQAQRASAGRLESLGITNAINAALRRAGKPPESARKPKGPKRAKSAPETAQKVARKTKLQGFTTKKEQDERGGIFSRDVLWCFLLVKNVSPCSWCSLFAICNDLRLFGRFCAPQMLPFAVSQNCAINHCGYLPLRRFFVFNRRFALVGRSIGWPFAIKTAAF